MILIYYYYYYYVTCKVKRNLTHIDFQAQIAWLLGTLRYGDYGLRTTAGRALSFVFNTGLSRSNIER